MFKITVDIDGMACGMCEAHVNDAIRRAFSVKKVSSSHNKGKAEILCAEVLTEDAIKDALASTGYKVLGVTVAPYEKKGFWIFGT